MAEMGSPRMFMDQMAGRVPGMAPGGISEQRPQRWEPSPELIAQWEMNQKTNATPVTPEEIAQWMEGRKNLDRISDPNSFSFNDPDNNVEAGGRRPWGREAHQGDVMEALLGRPMSAREQLAGMNEETPPQGFHRMPDGSMMPDGQMRMLPGEMPGRTIQLPMAPPSPPTGGGMRGGGGDQELLRLLMR